jgi:hypothetical protein
MEQTQVNEDSSPNNMEVNEEAVVIIPLKLEGFLLLLIYKNIHIYLSCK